MLIRTILSSVLLFSSVAFASSLTANGDDLLQQAATKTEDTASESDVKFLSRAEVQKLYVEKEVRPSQDFVDDVDDNFSSELIAEKGNYLVLRDVGK